MNSFTSPYSFTFDWFDWTRSRGLAPCSVRVRYSQLFFHYLFHLVKPRLHFLSLPSFPVKSDSRCIIYPELPTERSFFHSVLSSFSFRALLSFSRSFFFFLYAYGCLFSVLSLLLELDSPFILLTSSRRNSLGALKDESENLFLQRRGKLEDDSFTLVELFKHWADLLHLLILSQ